jgi:hypothetical protein
MASIGSTPLFLVSHLAKRRGWTLDNETWSYHFTPDVRYGREPLYQAFQLHRHHLHRYEWR